MPFFSQRMGMNPNVKGFKLEKIRTFIRALHKTFDHEGYFDQAFGKFCVDNGQMAGEIINPELDITMKVRKEDLWPIHEFIEKYDEADLFDIIEYLYQNVSKPIEGTMHGYAGCGMHWHTFNKEDGQAEFRTKINEILSLYERPFELSATGEVLEKAPSGLEPIFKADIPTKDNLITEKIRIATVRYRRHDATADDRRAAVRDLADILERLRTQVKNIMGGKDDSALFEIANKFAIRHFNKLQQTDYDPEWLSWMFYLYLSTIHLVTRKIEKAQKN